MDERLGSTDSRIYIDQPRDSATPEAHPSSYRRTRPHVTQEPIDDVEPEYVTRERYVTLDQQKSGHRHMGVATSDPQYLDPVGRNPRQSRPAPNATSQRGTNYARYLQTPKPGKSIFIARRNKARRRIRIVLAAAAIIIIITVIVRLVFF